MIHPRTINQSMYIRKLMSTRKPITVAVGPPGSGKTLLACHAATHQLLSNRVEKIVITRPLVSVDEEIGFLPGKLEQKMAPWIKPMFEIFEKEKVHKSVEIVPMGFMRGRTFKNSFIIADEMQNSTKSQMKMILTRLGEESKMVIAGDIDQSDICPHTNGLSDLISKISNTELEYIDHILFNDDDVQRHKAIREVLKLY